MDEQAGSLCAVLLLLLTISSATNVDDRDSDTSIQLVSFRTNTMDSLEALFKSGSLLFNITSHVQNQSLLSRIKEFCLEAEGGNAVSAISVVDLKRRGIDQSKVLSQIVIPGRLLYNRKIPDMEERIVHAAKDMLIVLQSQTQLTTRTQLNLVSLVKLYDSMINELLKKIDVQNKFNQGRASFIYHSSIARTALRLSRGVPPEGACPAHQAYEHKGLFACQQEYSQHAERVLSSPLFGCKDPTCVRNLQRSLGQWIDKKIEGLEIEAAMKIVEGILGLEKGNNSKLAEEIARLIACGNISCHEPGCNSWIYTEGWFIYGADWGCCGDYPGCCLLSSEVCLVHDAICTCCSFPSFCIDPLCKPDPWCSGIATTTPP